MDLNCFYILDLNLNIMMQHAALQTHCRLTEVGTLKISAETDFIQPSLTSDTLPCATKKTAPSDMDTYTKHTLS